MIRRALMLGLALALVWSAVAQAHAVLERSTPSAGADLRTQPDSVAFYFDEPIEASLGAVRVVNADGSEVQSGEVFRPEGDSSAIAIALQPDLSDGTYTATYRVLSADSHPVAGGFVFSIGMPTAGGGQSVATILDRADSGPVTSVAFWADRWLGYLAIGLAAGILFFLVAVWRSALASMTGAGADWQRASAEFSGRTRRLLVVAIAAGIAASLLALPLQVAEATGTSFWKALDPSLIGDVIDTRFGTVIAARAVAWILLALALIVISARRRSAISAIVVAAVPLAFLLVSPALAGHAASQSPEALLLPADVIHVSGMSLWLGGLACIVVALPASTRTLEPADRTRLLLANLRRFSPLALGAVVALAVTGTVQAIVEVGSVPALVETGFGRAVVVKVLLFAVLVGLGFANRNRFLPALARLAAGAESPGRIGVALRRSLRLETGVIVIVLAVTAVLVGYAPASQESAGPVSGRTTIGPAVLEYTVDPARVGSNQVHLYLFDADDGSQYDGARALELTAVEPDREIGPLPIELRKSGPGHYVAQGAQIGAPGDWELTLTMRTSRFEASEATLEVPVK